MNTQFLVGVPFLCSINFFEQSDCENMHFLVLHQILIKKYIIHKWNFFFNKAYFWDRTSIPTSIRHTNEELSIHRKIPVCVFVSKKILNQSTNRYIICHFNHFWCGHQSKREKKPTTGQNFSLTCNLIN